MAGKYARKIFLIATASLALAILPAAYFLQRPARFSSNDPVPVLTEYLKASYARDFRTAYRSISAQDKRLKSEKLYVRERGAFNGFTLEMARRLAAYIEVAPLETSISDNRAHVKLRLKIPDANRLSQLLMDWDEERLNALSAREQRALIDALEQRNKDRKLETVEGEEAFELVKENGRWRVFLNWAAGVRIRFEASVPPSSPLGAEPVQREVVITPGELFTIAYRVKNSSQRAVSARIIHRVEPKSIAEYLDIVECGLLFPVRLLPGEKAEYPTTYLIRGGLPEGTKRLAVTYEFATEQE